jgi:hypothetical protein
MFKVAPELTVVMPVYVLLLVVVNAPVPAMVKFIDPVKTPLPD